MLVEKLFNWFLCLFNKKKGEYKLVIVPELPQEPKNKVLYIEGKEELNDYWYALLKCPCGCNENIMLNLIDDANPCWFVFIDGSNFSISPSIWRTKNCRSHFFLKNRQIVWA
ncbi:DUF6527 family protein [Formosa sp. A9]|uniref:DUF6527 family protein n=1 Tax=Formosa sp. A9 TaxID=3442641 RepID=UPI003EB9D397